MSPLLKAKYSWASQGQLECIQLFVDLVGGDYNIKGTFIDIGADGVCIKEKRTFSTFDNNWLTRLVFLAHDRCIRVELQAAGHGLTWVILRKRQSRDGYFMDRHPTLAEALQDYQKSPVGFAPTDDIRNDVLELCRLVIGYNENDMETAIAKKIIERMKVEK